MLSKAAEALNLLRKELLGDFYYRFSAGDSWMFSFNNGVKLMAIEMSSSEESKLNEMLTKQHPVYMNTTDRDIVAQSIVASTQMRQLVTDVQLDADMTLTLTFENGEAITFQTDTEVVDWQWCMNRSGQIPYLDLLVACLSAGEIEVNEKNQK